VPPEGEIEEALARAWLELLGVSRVSRHDNFFTLGGHSLFAVRLSSRVTLEFGIELPVAVIFKERTLSALAQYLREHAAANASDAVLEGVIA